MTRADIRLMRKTTVMTTSTQKRFGTCIEKHKARATKKMWRFLHSTMLFCCGVFVHVVWWRIPFYLRKISKGLIHKLTTIVRVKGLNLGIKLCDNHFGKSRNDI